MKSRRKWILFISTFITAITLLVVYLTSILGLWNDGIAYIANNTKEYNNTQSHLIKGEYSISIDLKNLKSNIGKELYNDGKHKIYVSSIDVADNEESKLIFRSVGSYSLTNASLISGVQHSTINNIEFTSTMLAKMTTTYNGKLYNNSEIGISGINFKDGDEFSFEMIPSNLYETNSLDEIERIDLTVTNLYKNIWIKN